jgi:pimeloyl-ACP methyl ester carboxylesterase
VTIDVTTENNFVLLNHCKFPYSKEVVVTILAIMLFVSIALYQQEGVAQLQPQQQTLSNRTANEVSRLVILDVPIAGTGPELNLTCLWHIPFHMARDIPETLVEGKEREYLTWFYRNGAYNPAAITEDDIDEYVSHYSAPGGMRAGFEYYRAIPLGVEQIKEYSKVKLPMPVLALGGEYSFGTAALDSMKSLATDVRGGIVPLSGHWIAEERPDFLTEQLFKFFGNSTTIGS